MMIRPPQGAVQNMSDAMYEAATDCFMCQKKFQVFRRKHRCRSCGNAVCGSCARSHKVMPSTTIVRYNNEPVRVCDRCVHDQNQMMMERRRAEDIERARARQLAVAEEEQRMRAAEEMRRDQEVAEQAARDKSRAEMRLRALEEKHLGPRPDSHKLRRSKSLDDCSRLTVSLYTKEIDLFIGDAEKRSFELLAGTVNDGEHVPTAESATAAATIVQEAEECAICLDTMDVGHAIYTTACGHSFHWSCLKEIQSSDSSNYDKCPSCRAIMTEMQVKKHCDHPRVRAGHRFCRDCGKSVTERDVKPRPNEHPPPPPPMTNDPGMAPNQPVSYRASSHGALVRCPQCHIQMRVLPHMYNMRVACPSGHMFLVQVAGGVPGGGGMGFGHGSGMSMGSRSAPRGTMSGYPGSSYYRSANSYSEL